MNAVSLFAGIGGFDLALERNGHTVTDQVEIDSHARKTLARHFPDTRLHEDIHDFGIRRNERRLGQGGDSNARDEHRQSKRSGRSDISTHEPGEGGAHGDLTDIVVGGFPCQDYSVAGRRGGLAGDRGALWWQMHRVINESRPTWVVGENVSGLVSSNDGRDFRTIIDSLVDLGYGVVWRILDAQYFGVAQRRRRVFIVGHSGGQPRPEVLALGQGSIGDTPPSRETRKGAGPTLEARTRGGGGTGTDFALNGGLITNANPAYALTARDRPEAGAATLIGSFAWQATGNNDASSAFNNAVEPTPTLPTSQTLAVGFRPATVRRLTPLECERLQGFPDGWTEGNSDTQRYRQLGNAVAVPVVEWIVRNLTNTHNQRATL